MSAGILEVANAKINLSLKVKGRLPNGYHQLESLVVFASVADRITCNDADALGLEISGPFADQLIDEKNNLVLNAARVFAGALGRDPSVKFELEKNLPIASGIGGGSADAAAALRAMMRLWGDPVGSIDGIALQLGADVPVCVRKRPSFMTGVGESIRAVPRLPEIHAVLANPGIGVSTADVFQHLQAGPVDGPERLPLLPGVETLDLLVLWLEENGNDLEVPAMDIAPAIKTVIDELKATAGCRLARMSGSGATCFALYDNPFDSAEAAATLKKKHIDWWVTATRFLGSQ
ncbi:4-(cytidine 5'-diphospho)-2-C-methyl-D-erythritol kinase [Parvibaculaceae bacterium PLY_AMNH_Bact1]|nr:4-(cytidine 5'-diphospho)-2-C-methyl-D-erythritol kinase [Parvibaculaceae bacterium PLY_AMNH_Bact1]